MSGLTVFKHDVTGEAVLGAEQPGRIAAQLEHIGLRLDRRGSPADVARPDASTPGGAAMQEKFLSEHVDGRVGDAHRTAADRIAVDSSGWIAHYTGSSISERFVAG